MKQTVRSLVTENLVIMLHNTAHLLIGISDKTLDEHSPIRKPTGITLMEDLAVRTHRTIGQTLTVKTQFFLTGRIAHINTRFTRRTGTGSGRDGRTQRAGSSVKVILITAMVFRRRNRFHGFPLLAITPILMLVHQGKAAHARILCVDKRVSIFDCRLRLSLCSSSNLDL